MGWDACLVGSGRGSLKWRGEERRGGGSSKLPASARGLWLMTLSGRSLGVWAVSVGDEAARTDR